MLSTRHSNSENTATFGCQFDSPHQPYSLAVAHTPSGNIPGKAFGRKCWYPEVSLGGISTETSTKYFSLVVDKNNTLCLLVRSSSSSAAEDTLLTDAKSKRGLRGRLLSISSARGNVCTLALAKSAEHGIVPGILDGDACWYSYDGSAYRSQWFYLVSTGPRRLKTLAVERSRVLLYSRNGAVAKKYFSSVLVPEDIILAIPTPDHEDILRFELAKTAEEDMLFCQSDAERESCVNTVRSLWKMDSIELDAGRYSVGNETFVITVELDESGKSPSKSFASVNLRRASGSRLLASACVALGVRFGHRLIQRALLESLRCSAYCDVFLKPKLFRSNIQYEQN